MTTITFSSLNGLTITTAENLALCDWEFDNVVLNLNQRVPEHIRQFLYPHLRLSLGDTTTNGRNADFNNATTDIRIFTEICHSTGFFNDKTVDNRLV